MARIGRIEKMTASASGSVSPGLTTGGTHLRDSGVPSGRSPHSRLVAGGARVRHGGSVQSCPSCQSCHVVAVVVAGISYPLRTAILARFTARPLGSCRPHGNGCHSGVVLWPGEMNPVRLQS